MCTPFEVILYILFNFNFIFSTLHYCTTSKFANCVCCEEYELPKKTRLPLRVGHVEMLYLLKQKYIVTFAVI